MYGRTFRITDCDEFTRNFLSKLGFEVPPPEPAPEDPYTAYRTTQKRLSEKVSIIFARTHTHTRARAVWPYASA